jgi:hypothetical protein
MRLARRTEGPNPTASRWQKIGWLAGLILAKLEKMNIVFKILPWLIASKFYPIRNKSPQIAASAPRWKP